MKLDEAQLYRAAKLADAMELAMLPDEDSLPKHEFSEQFEHDMELLIAKVKRNEIRPYKVFMGWRYYTKRGIAAILICFLLACVTMPEAVIAGYHKLIEVIEYVVTEYTEYRYQSNVPIDEELERLELRNLPEGLQLVDEQIDSHKFRVVYENGDKYFILKQRIITEKDDFFLVADSQNANTEIRMLRGMRLYILCKEDAIIYIWQYDKYHISGITNISVDDLEEALSNIKF